MNKIIIPLLLMLYSNILPQSLKTSVSKIDEAFTLAVKTIDNNTRDGILAAGADYGGEWTRDISINSWHCVSLFRPVVAETSLWSVTLNRDTIGHQYWDKIIWVTGALNHYKVTGDTPFLKQALVCSENTIKQLEETAFDNTYGLFTGPSVFNDGIAGYPEPVFDRSIENSFVLEHHAADIKCLSTNCLYYGAYLAINEMIELTGIHKEKQPLYKQKAAELKKNILKNFYKPDENTFIYLIDEKGEIYSYQEALGISFAILFGVIDAEDAAKAICNVKISSYGITSIYPDFPYFSADKPGRHNNIVWPFVNGFWSLACLEAGDYNKFYFELQNLASLAVDEDKGNKNFREIYNPYTGKPDGGWQLGSHWESCNHQTWSATAYIAMILKGLAGMKFEKEGIYFTPYLTKELNSLELNDIPYRNVFLDIKITGSGTVVKSFTINGRPSDKYFIPAETLGKTAVEIKLTEK